jgi:hypothetical protein
MGHQIEEKDYHDAAEAPSEPVRWRTVSEPPVLTCTRTGAPVYDLRDNSRSMASRSNPTIHLPPIFMTGTPVWPVFLIRS